MIVDEHLTLENVIQIKNKARKKCPCECKKPLKNMYAKKVGVLKKWSPSICPCEWESYIQNAADNLILECSSFQNLCYLFFLLVLLLIIVIACIVFYYNRLGVSIGINSKKANDSLVNNF